MEYHFEYKGKWIGLNQLYGKNRYLSNITKNEYKEVFTNLINKQDIKPFDTFKVELIYNSRMDCENTTAGLKIFVDVLRNLGIIQNDDKRYYQGLTITPDTSLPHNTYQIKLIVLSE